MTVRERVLRSISPQAAIVFYVQNLRDHVQTFAQSPFAQAFARSALGQRLGQSFPRQQLERIADLIMQELKTSPQEVLDEVLGDAWAFAYTPAADADHPEHSLLVIASRRPQVLQRIVQRIGELQLRSGEVADIAQRCQGRHTFTSRKKRDGSIDCFTFHDGLFLFSSSEAELLSALDRASAPEPSSWEQRLQRWELHEAALVVAVEPRNWDGEWAKRIAAAQGPQRLLVERWAQWWKGLKAAALSVQLTEEVAISLTVEVVPQSWPAAWQSLGLGAAPTARNPLPPADAWLACQLHGRLDDWIDALEFLLPTPQEGQRPLSGWFEQNLGPLVGRDQLPILRRVLGPSWALWLEPPESEVALPALAVAVTLQGTAEERRTAARALSQALAFVFHAYRVQHNARHKDQVTWLEPPGGPPGLSGMLVNEGTFPPGFRPCFAVWADHLVIATSARALERFRQRLNPAGPTASPKVGPETALWIDTRSLHEYLARRHETLARQLAPLFVVEEKKLHDHLSVLADVLEPFDAIRLDFSHKQYLLRLTLHLRPRWALRSQR